MKRDHVFEKDGCWWAQVNGHTYGAWRSRGEAVAGMQVEQRRARAANAPVRAIPYSEAHPYSTKQLRRPRR